MSSPSDATPPDADLPADTAAEAEPDTVDGAEDDSTRETFPPTGNPWLAVLLAWLVPGLGHLYLRRWRRAPVFAAVVLTAVVAGYLLHGELWTWSAPAGIAIPGFTTNLWLHRLLGVVAMGMGGPWFVLQGVGYRGDFAAPGYEYGITFFFTAAIMNLLLVLDAWDISRGYKR